MVRDADVGAQIKVAQGNAGIKPTNESGKKTTTPIGSSKANAKEEAMQQCYAKQKQQLKNCEIKPNKECPEIIKHAAEGKCP